MTEHEYINVTSDSLRHIFNEVTAEWHPFVGQGRRIFSPRIDIAVGPFATENRYENEYDNLINQNVKFIENLIAKHNENVREIEEETTLRKMRDFNSNSQCFLCIEIENTGSKKHLLGDLVNASALGRIGILIARSDKVFRAFLRQRVYLSYLWSVGKNTFRTDNALVLREEQFDDCLRSL